MGFGFFSKILRPRIADESALTPGFNPEAAGPVLRQSPQVRPTPKIDGAPAPIEQEPPYMTHRLPGGNPRSLPAAAQLPGQPAPMPATPPLPAITPSIVKP